MLEQKIITATIEALNLLGVEPTDTICELVEQFAAAVAAAM